MMMNVRPSRETMVCMRETMGFTQNTAMRRFLSSFD